jgi:hypothetical protein
MSELGSARQSHGWGAAAAGVRSSVVYIGHMKSRWRGARRGPRPADETGSLSSGARPWSRIGTGVARGILGLAVGVRRARARRRRRACSPPRARNVSTGGARRALATSQAEAEHRPSHAAGRTADERHVPPQRLRPLASAAFDVHPHVPADRVATAGQLHLPLESERAAVKAGVEQSRDLAEAPRARGGVVAAGADRSGDAPDRQLAVVFAPAAIDGATRGDPPRCDVS